MSTGNKYILDVFLNEFLQDYAPEFLLTVAEQRNLGVMDVVLRMRQINPTKYVHYLRWVHTQEGGSYWAIKSREWNDLLVRAGYYDNRF